MKKILSLTLAAITAASVFAGCAQVSPEDASPIHAVSSSAESSAKWLRDRLGDSVNGDIFLATSDDADRFGIDISSLRDDGYVIRRNGGDTVILGSTEDGLDRGARYFANYCAEQDEIDVTYGEGFRVKKLTIAGRDISEYSIYLFPDADECHTFAAQELRKYIGLACGYYPNIVNEKRDHMIVLEQLLDDPTLGEEGFTLSVKDDGNLYITGGKWRGCMYGVWRFLQKECGWTSLIYGDSDLLEAEHLDVPATASRQETPVFSYLNMYIHYWGSYNNEKGTPTEAQNSYGTIPHCCHGLHFFSGTGGADKQICYTDDDIYEMCRDNVRDYIEAQLAAGKVIGRDFLAVDIAQNDTSEYCTCRECMKVFSAEGSNSGAVVRFANRLSEELNEDYPGLYYQIFAYAGSNAAPLKTKPNEFIHVTFCSDMNCYLKSRRKQRVHGAKSAPSRQFAPSTVYEEVVHLNPAEDALLHNSV